jgi:cytochrome o ubiquinol oxidase subunit 2
MVNKLNLISDKTGEFPGSTAEMSGSGFAAMRFKARAVPQEDFNDWIESVRQSPDMLMKKNYEELAKPGPQKETVYYSMYEPGLYNSIMMKYMMPINK